VRFDLRTGKPMGEMTRIPLKTYDIRVDENGNLELDMDIDKS